MSRKNNNIRRYFSLLLACLYLGACSSVEEKPEAKIFYPPLPNAPRIQYLATFSTDRDLSGKENSFANYLLGEDVNKDSLISKPYGVGYYQGKLYVVDIRGPGYAVFDFINNKTYTVHGKGSGRMKKPINMTIDKDGNKFVSDTQRNQVLQYDRDDKYVRSYGTGNDFKPSDVAVSEDKLFISDVKNHKIHVLDHASGKELYSFGKGGSDEGELLYPTNLKLAADGYLYISDTGNSRICKVSQDGKFIKYYGKVGSGLGQFARPKGVAIDKRGQIYVVDAAFENVQLFSPEGKLLLFFGGKGDDADRLILPADIEIAEDHIEPFNRYAEPGFSIEYLLMVSNQFSPNKVHVYGYGKMANMEYKN